MGTTGSKTTSNTCVSRQNCRNSSYKIDEASTACGRDGLGENQCRNDCDCTGSRGCSLAGWCQYPL